MISVAVASSLAPDTRSDVILFAGSAHIVRSLAHEPLEKFYKEGLKFVVIYLVYCDTITQHRPTKRTLVKFNVNFSKYLLPVHVSDPEGSSPGRQL
jgi:hypothetical protein